MTTEIPMVSTSVTLETEVAVEIVAAFVGSQTILIGDLGAFIREVYTTLRTLSVEPTAELINKEPAVSIRRSVTPDFLICLEDGRKLKMLKRHLRSTYDLSPEEYRAKWNLPVDYPMVAPNYAKRRSELALSAGLGRKPAVAPPPPPASPARTRGRRKTAASPARTRGRRKTAASPAS